MTRITLSLFSYGSHYTLLRFCSRSRHAIRRRPLQFCASSPFYRDIQWPDAVPSCHSTARTAAHADVPRIPTPSRASSASATSSTPASPTSARTATAWAAVLHCTASTGANSSSLVSAHASQCKRVILVISLLVSSSLSAHVNPYLSRSGPSGSSWSSPRTKHFTPRTAVGPDTTYNIDCESSTSGNTCGTVRNKTITTRVYLATNENVDFLRCTGKISRSVSNIYERSSLPIVWGC